jgi:glycosyltransferase involved in cell wall biosynthesis
MKADSVWVIVPFSRPQYLKNVLDNFTRQDFQNKKLVIVENGDAIGTCIKHGVEPDILLSSLPHQAEAKNEALAAIRRRGYGFWATFDDDDYYGPGYLSEMVGYSDRAEVVGKGDFFVRLAGGDLLLFEGIGSLQYTNFVHGPTICSWAELCMDFPNTGRIGEDCALVKDMLVGGASVWAASKHNFIFKRYPGEDHHTWKMSDEKLIHSLSFGIGFDPVVKNYGQDVPYDFINGIGEEPEYEQIVTAPKDSEILAAIDDGPTKEFTKKALVEMGLIEEGEEPEDKLKRKDVTFMFQNTFLHGAEVFRMEGDDAYPVREGVTIGEDEP